MALQEIPDVCLIDGVEQPLWPSPLEVVIAALGLSPIACDLCSACHRGYVARWELREEGLYLLAVDHWRGDGVRVDFEASSERFSLIEPLASVLPAMEYDLRESHLLDVSAWLKGLRDASLLASWVRDPRSLRSFINAS